jgi:hypothetical protein
MFNSVTMTEPLTPYLLILASLLGIFSKLNTINTFVLNK